MPAMITAPVTTTPMRIRCIRVSCSGAATRTPLPLRAVARNRVAQVSGERRAGTAEARPSQGAGLRQKAVLSCVLASRCDGQLFFDAEEDGDGEEDFATFNGEADGCVEAPCFLIM